MFTFFRNDISWVCSESRDSSVGTATDYKFSCQASIPGSAKRFASTLQCLTGSTSHPASYPVGTEGFFRGVKAAGTWSWTVTSV
jgi:hypothetical protein